MQSILHNLKFYLHSRVAPVANDIDSNPDALSLALRGLGELGLLTIRVPEVWGGKNVDEQTFHHFQELVARYSGALAFLQTQHQSAAGMLLQSQNTALQQEYLPRMAKGEKLVGVGFSQLRRETPPTSAIPVAGGYELNGFVPWVTGYGLFTEFIVAATLEDGSAVFGLVPFQDASGDRGGEITFSPPAKLGAMTSTNTVTSSLKNWFLLENKVVFLKPPGWIDNNDKNNVLRATSLALGCALAGLDILHSTYQHKSLSFIQDAWETLQREISNCRTAIFNAPSAKISYTEKLQLRAWAIDLAVRCSHAAVTVASGAANYLHHPAQRVYREALVFTVTGQTTEVMAATLKRITPPPTPYSASSDGEVKTITYSRVVHLSHEIHPHIPQWQGDPSVSFTTFAELDTHGYFLRRFSMGEHSATHINAPNSFYSDGAGIESYNANNLVLPAVVIDIQKQTQAHPDYTLTIADITTWEQHFGEIPSGCMVLLYTGWQERWSDKTAFFNYDELGNPHFPGFGEAAVEFLLTQRQVAGVGIDTHGVDAGCDNTFSVNRLVLEKPRLVLENLTNLHQLPATGAALVIGILRLQGGSGSPAGVVALVP